jgi:ferrochelatase
MSVGVVLLNFGEPEQPTEEVVVPFLERIFASNASLEGSVTEEQARARSRALALQRAPGLIEEYLEIGGSPLNRQAAEQAAALQDELVRRGIVARTYVGMQFTDPSIREAVERARADGVERLVGLPVYPLCGPSTTVAALAELRAQVDALGWGVEVIEITGWHRHPAYVELRAEGIRRVVEENGLDLANGRTRLVFSVHGTPMRYIEEGSRYVEYAEESCRAIAAAAGAPDYDIGYQNHTNRPIAWTQPDIEAVIDGLTAEHVVVVPVSFMHEQSETLAELDIELREAAEARGLGFHRVPVPHDDARFIALLADLVEAALASGRAAGLTLASCTCRRTPGTWCLDRAATLGS